MRERVEMVIEMDIEMRWWLRLKVEEGIRESEEAFISRVRRGSKTREIRRREYRIRENRRREIE